MNSWYELFLGKSFFMVIWSFQALLIVKHLSFITLVTSVVRKQNSSTAPSTDQNLFSTVNILFPYLIFVLLFQGLISAWFGKKCDYNLLTHCDTGSKNRASSARVLVRSRSMMLSKYWVMCICNGTKISGIKCYAMQCVLKLRKVLHTPCERVASARHGHGVLEPSVG